MPSGVAHFLFVEKDSNLEKARTIKKNSPVDCFFSEWCAGGYCKQSLRSPSRADAQHMHPVIPTKKTSDTFTVLLVLFYLFEIYFTRIINLNLLKIDKTIIGGKQNV